MESSSYGRFELCRELGRGGMGIVFEALDIELQKPVALKVLHRAEPETIGRLKQEFRSLSSIAHPNLIAMHELLCEQERWFFTMKFVRDGMNFMEHIRGSAAADGRAGTDSARSKRSNRWKC